MTESTILRLAAVALAAAIAFGGDALAQTTDAPQQPVKLEDVVVKGAAAKQAYEKHLLRLDVAEKIAKACFAYAAGNDFAVALHIVDQFGYSIYAGRMDGRKADNIETAEMKARTALYFREPSRVWMERSRQNPLMPHLLQQMGQFPVAGGLPIIVEDQLVGAIGVGGGTSDQDEDCARAGLLQVLGPQPGLVAADNR
ncbi:MAG: heme-binding protein [Woeseia sp.]